MNNLRISLDTENKTIKVEGTPNMGELVSQLKKLLPKDSPFGAWDTYSLISDISIRWYNPIYIPYSPPTEDVTYAISCGGTGIMTTSGVYNIEFQANGTSSS